MACCDYRYERSKVDPAFLPFFERLQAGLGADYQLWVRLEDFGRQLGAGVVNPASQIAVHIPLKKGLLRIRTTLSAAELATIRGHLSSNAAQDLVLYPPRGSQCYAVPG